jgi:hypothetical protein
MHRVSNQSRPTTRQLRYLKLLTQMTATTFAYPQTKAQASREIERLQQLPRAGRERQDDDGSQFYATAVRGEDVRGRGASAAWRHSRDRDARTPAVRATAAPASRGSVADA